MKNCYNSHQNNDGKSAHISLTHITKHLVQKRHGYNTGYSPSIPTREVMKKLQILNPTTVKSTWHEHSSKWIDI